MTLSENGQQSILQRTIPPDAITSYTEKVAGLEERIAEMLREERENKKIDDALREAERVENLIEFEDEIKSRPSRSWYQSESQKKASAEASKLAAEKALDELDENGETVRLDEQGRRDSTIICRCG